MYNLEIENKAIIFTYQYAFTDLLEHIKLLFFRLEKACSWNAKLL